LQQLAVGAHPLIAIVSPFQNFSFFGDVAKEHRNQYTQCCIQCVDSIRINLSQVTKCVAVKGNKE
jgi:hypothetical protein